MMTYMSGPPFQRPPLTNRLSHEKYHSSTAVRSSDAVSDMTSSKCQHSGRQSCRRKHFEQTCAPHLQPEEHSRQETRAVLSSGRAEPTSPNTQRSAPKRSIQILYLGCKQKGYALSFFNCRVHAPIPSRCSSSSSKRMRLGRSSVFISYMAIATARSAGSGHNTSK